MVLDSVSSLRFARKDEYILKLFRLKKKNAHP